MNGTDSNGMGKKKKRKKRGNLFVFSSWVWGTRCTIHIPVPFIISTDGAAQMCSDRNALRTFLNGERVYIDVLRDGASHGSSISSSSSRGNNNTRSTHISKRRKDMDWTRKLMGARVQCPKSTQGHTLKNRDYILNLLSVRTCSRAQARAHFSYFVNVQVNVAHENRVVCMYAQTRYTHTHPALRQIQPSRLHSFSFSPGLSLFVFASFFFFLFVSLLNRLQLPLSISVHSATGSDRKKATKMNAHAEETNVKRWRLKLSFFRVFFYKFLFAPLPSHTHNGLACKKSFFFCIFWTF